MSHEPRATSHEPRIAIVVENDKSHLVEPNFIYNRFDLWTGIEGCPVETLHVTCGGKDYYVQVLYRSEVAKLGLWLSNIPSEAIDFIAAYLFRTHDNICCVKFELCMNKSVLGRKENHFRIELPDSVEELNGRISSKFRYNLKRERKMLEKVVGSLSFEEYEAHDFPSDIMPEYFRMKAITRRANYHNMTAREYIDRYQATNAYVIRSSDNGKIISMVLSCEQCPIAYIENLTYNAEYAKYSPGKMAYHYFLESLVKKKKPEVFLRGGDYEYKRHYGSIEETAYSGVIYRQAWRNIINRTFNILRGCAKKILPNRMIRALRILRSIIRNLLDRA